jgi:outer membrane protein assembly factor BamB
LSASHDWGYVARAGDLLYGSSVKQGAVYTDFWGKESWYDGTSGAGTEKVCSDDLFAMASASGEVKWRYRGGVVINPTIAIADGKVLFVECRHPEVKALTTSRIGSPKLWENQYLIALDARTGAKLWEQPVDTADGIVVFYLLAAEDKVFIASSAAGKYNLYAVSAAEGKNLWQATHNWPNDNHGGHMQHPVVVHNTIFLEPCGYEATTGKLLTNEVGRHGGCATYAATANALIYRGEGGRIAMWDMADAVVTSWYNLRPSCWLSTVPANGMVLSPEGGGGCSCGNWLETSIGFAPVPGATVK